MLAIILLAALATVQVECAPNQLWPAFEKVSAQPLKKPIFATTINKETETKAYNPSATQHAYEQFINTWLRQASLTLNRPELLKLVTSVLSPNTNVPAQPVIGESAISPVVVQEPVAPVAVFDTQVGATEEIAMPVAADPLLAEPDYFVAEPELVPEVAAIPKQMMTSVAVEMAPDATSLAVSDVVDIVPEPAEVAVELTPLEPVAELTPLEPVVEFVPLEPLAEEMPTQVVQMPVAEDTFMTPIVEEVVAESIPSLVDQDTATVLGLSPPTPSPEPELIPEVAVEVALEPLATTLPLELLQPIAESKTVFEPVPKKAEPESFIPTGRSFNSARNAKNVILQEPAVRHQSIPAATFVPKPLAPEAAAPVAQSPIPTFAATAFPSARVPAFNLPGPITTDGLAYTLQFFPTRGGSHYFVSTPIGG